ncbi:MAG: biotin-dependent carboxyltransferase family protein [Pseudomonadota bacterium]
MTRRLTVKAVGPGVTVQDLGRPGYRALGLTQGGAADQLALYEGAALLGQDARLAAIEMAGSGGTFSVDADARIALTGAEMTVRLDGEALAWHASHLLPAGSTLEIGGARAGSYGYLHLGGGIDTPEIMGARGSHLAGGIGGTLNAGDALPLGPDPRPQTGMILLPEDRLAGGTLRVVASMQTKDFAPEALARFTSTTFHRDARANRMGVRLALETEGFATEEMLSIVSEVVVPGDIQIAGDGAPYILLYECQTTGGYPRIGTVLPCDLPRAAQAPIGAPLRFEMVEMAEAVSAQKRYLSDLVGLPQRIMPLVRDPGEIADLLSYQLVGGAVSALQDPFT